ncbi:MAG: 1,4-dihydroxy-2-naphthoate octaprenyltransferase [Bacteroidia bacterium]|nr:1,4-dihydroxy-2-naphthoate octaprenyltransferase [Bacteroidia bacterium]
MTGFSFAGVLFTPPDLWNDWLKNISVLFFVLIYVMAVYFLNSFADYESDVKSQRLEIIGTISKSKYISFFVVFCALFSSLAIYIDIKTFIFSISAMILWSLYYLPPLRLKSTYLIGTLVHFIAGIFHFHSGYCSFADYNESSLAISIYFALLLSVGHFHHELMDYEADKAAGNLTTAVRIGINKIQYLRTGLTLLTLIYWIVVFLMNYTSKEELLVFLVPTTLLLMMSALMKQNNVKKFQIISRALFLLAGFILLGIKITELAKNYF